MGQDQGMDAHPTIQELQDENDRLHALMMNIGGRHERLITRFMDKSKEAEVFKERYAKLYTFVKEYQKGNVTPEQARDLIDEVMITPEIIDTFSYYQKTLNL